MLTIRRSGGRSCQGARFSREQIANAIAISGTANNAARDLIDSGSVLVNEPVRQIRRLPFG